jgi:sirohydrochlorin cobaltochelatase
MADQGLILFAHGARDPRWAEPFERLLGRVRERRDDVLSTLAFLEHIAPDLPTAVRELTERGAKRIRIVPMFFGRGGHLRDDFPAILAEARAAAPGVDFDVTAAAGEDATVIEALTDFALADL